MKAKMIFQSVFFFGFCLMFLRPVSAQDFQATEVADKVFVIEKTDGGEGQIVIASDRGLVVLNSFWSEITARNYKNGIVETLHRDDFLYLINMVDRLDVFGGNAAYDDITIIGHKAILDEYQGQEDDVNAEITRLIEMWREKEGYARERLPSHEPGSERAINEQIWIDECHQRAEELEQGFSLVLPDEIYEDRKTLKLGDMNLNLIWFGRAGYEGITVIVIPEAKLAILSGFIMHPHHLAPYPMAAFARLDVPRWIAVLEEILEGDDAVENVLCDTKALWSRERAHTHLVYIRELWGKVKAAEAEGVTLDEIYNRLSMDGEFAFVKEMQVYLDGGDDWIRPQHQMHIRQFFMQHKKYVASDILKNAGLDSVSAALDKIRKLHNEGEDIYIDERAINRLAYLCLNMEEFDQAVEVFKLNVEAFPESYNVYDSYAEALMKSGDSSGAIINYRKSLEINPDNDNARAMLQVLEGQ